MSGGKSFSSEGLQKGRADGGLRLSRKDKIRYGAAGAVLSFGILYVFYRSIVVASAFSLPGAYMYLRLKRAELEEKRRLRLSAEFKECAEILSSYINAGYSVENAFLIVYKEAERLFGRESEVAGGFRKIVDGIRLNKPVEELLWHFAESSGLQEIQSLSEVFSIAKRTGGDLKEIIDRTAGVIREKAELREEIKNLTAAKRYEQRIMTVMPVLVIIYIDFTQPDFLNLMYHTAAGRIVMTICLTLFAVSYILSVYIMGIDL